MTIKFYRVSISLLLLLLIWFGVAIVRLENFHYAVQVGFCADVSASDRSDCLDKKETRTSSLLYLLYGLKIL